MSAPFLFVNTFTYGEGRLDDALQACKAANEIIEANEPRMLAHHVYVDDAHRRMALVQIHTDSASMAYHLNVVLPQILHDASWLESEESQLILGPDDDGVAESLKVWEPQSQVAVPAYVQGFTRPASVHS